MSKSSSLWLYLHFPALQLDSLYSHAIDEVESVAATVSYNPVVVVDGRANSVVQLSESAKMAGICLGMGLGTASALHAQLQVLSYQPRQERTRLEEIAQGLYQLTSDIALFGSNGLLLEVSGMLALYGGLHHYWKQVDTHLASLGLRYFYATGNTPLAARLLARTGFNRVIDARDELDQACRARALVSTELPDMTVEQLQRVGLRTVGDLVDIPMCDLAQRFDLDLVTYCGRLQGTEKHPLLWFIPPEHFSCGMDLLYEIEATSSLMDPVAQLLLRLQSYLDARDLIAHRLVIGLALRNQQYTTLELSAVGGAANAEHWKTLLSLKLDRLTLQAPVIALRLEAQQVQGRNAHSEDLFDKRKSGSDAGQLVSLLQARLGEKQVKGVALTHDVRPELTSETCAFAPPSATASRSVQSKQVKLSARKERFAFPKKGIHTLVRPSLLLPAPQPLTQRVSLTSGPERIATGWWDENKMARDYFVARNRNGQWLWVFRTQKNDWFLHGLFA